jgi:hypothetical protein
LPHPVTEDFFACLQGYRYTFGQFPLKLVLMLLGIVSLMGTPYVVLLPIYVVHNLHSGAEQLGLLMAVAGFGSLIGAIFLAARTSVQGLEKLLTVAAALIGLGLVLLAFSDAIYVSLVAMLVVGLGYFRHRRQQPLSIMLTHAMRARVMIFPPWSRHWDGRSAACGGAAWPKATAHLYVLACGAAWPVRSGLLFRQPNAFRVPLSHLRHSGNLDSVEQCKCVRRSIAGNAPAVRRRFSLFYVLHHSITANWPNIERGDRAYGESVAGSARMWLSPLLQAYKCHISAAWQGRRNTQYSGRRERTGRVRAVLPHPSIWTRVLHFSSDNDGSADKSRSGS